MESIPEQTQRDFVRLWFVVFFKSSSVAHRKLRQWFKVLSADKHSDPAVPDGSFS